MLPIGANPGMPLAPFLLDLAAHVEAFIAVPKVSHCDVHPLISKHAGGDASEPAAPTGNQGDSIAQFHRRRLFIRS